jgi:integrase
MNKNDKKSTHIESLHSITPDNTEQTYSHYQNLATSSNTLRAYQAAIHQFEAAGGLLPTDGAAIAKYITQKAEKLNPRTLSLHLTALSHWHREHHLPDPTQALSIRKLLQGVKREHGRPKQKAKALRPEHLHTLIAHLKSDENKLRAARDSALLQVAYFGAFRRSELVAIQVDHLKFEPEGLLILIPKSKTDQMGTGKVKALPYGKTESLLCPIRAVKSWLEISKITEGFLFRAINRWGQIQNQALTPDSINLMMKSLGKKCQFDFIDVLSSHSARRGFATSAARAGATFESIKRQGGWNNDSTVREYIEAGQIFDDNAAKQLIEFAFNKQAEE